MNSIAIFCGSSPGNDDTITKAVRELGAILAKNNIRTIYGGANVGIMGVLADSCLKHGGEVVGVLPEFIKEKEIAHTNLTELHIVDTMHERKALIAKMADGFIALPGGLGTLDELFEIWGWFQLRLHQNPVGLLNINHYFDKLLEFLQHACDTDFLKPDYLKHLLVEDNPHALIARILSKPTAPNIDKWHTLEKS